MPFFGEGFGNGLWLAFIGWFIATAANQASARLALDDAFAGMTVAQLMRRTFPPSTPEMPLDVVVQEYLVRGSDRAVAVVRDDRMLGLVVYCRYQDGQPGPMECNPGGGRHA